MPFLRASTLLLALLTPLLASAGTIQTLDGKTHEGDVRIENGQLVIGPRRGATTKLDLADILLASFKPTESPRPERPAAAPTPAQLDRLWKTQDVGPTGTAGSVGVSSDGRYAVKGAGSNIKGSADSFYFVYQELRGDGQIFARLADLQIVNPFEKAGVMIREAANERGSRCAFMFLTPQDGSSFSWRAEKSGDMASTPLAAGDKPPAWLRLTRQRNIITAYKSIDGNSWIPVGQPQEVPMEPRVYVGLAVCSRDTNAACAATFEAVTVQPGRPREDATPPRLTADGVLESARPQAPPLARAVVLRSGSVLAHAQVRSADDKTIHILRADGKQEDLSTRDVARLVLGPATPQQLARIPAAASSGVLLAKGDFLEGELESIQNNRVRVNSVVFGPRELAAGSEALVVVLHEVANAGGPAGTSAAWIVKTAEGVIYMARSLRMEKDQLIVEDDTGVTTRVPGARLAEIKAGGGRYDSLADLRPQVKIDPTAAASGLATTSAYTTASPAGTPITLDGKVPDRVVIQEAGVSLEYDLSGKYRLLLCRCGVPDLVLPTTAVRLMVTADGLELYRSPPQTGLDDAVSLSLKLNGAKTLTLRIETAGNVNLPAAGVWGDAMLVK
jgi:regulation of enolase protein 1 (concanavalin A-like superfamily)